MDVGSFPLCMFSIYLLMHAKISFIVVMQWSVFLSCNRHLNVS